MADSPLKLGNLGQQAAIATDQSKIGDLRRRYNFGSAVSELAIEQTPFFRFLSQVGVSPTDDPEFKSTEERSSWHKRYGYVMGHDADGADAPSVVDGDYVGTQLALGEFAQGQVFSLKIGSDHTSEGNIQNILGQSQTSIGASGTAPIWMLKGQMLKIPVYIATSATSSTKISDDYIIVRITDDPKAITSTHAMGITVKVVRGVVGAGDNVPAFVGQAYADAAWSLTASAGEASKVYAVGSAHAEGSGFPATYKDSPYMVRTGYTQIFKTTCQMTNTARATQLKFAQDEWARVWKSKLIEHKYDIETALLFGTGHVDGTTMYSQGIIDFVLQNGNIFSWTEAKSSDDFLEDMSSFLDPRYNNSGATLFMCNTAVYNWLHKLGGYLSANMASLNAGTGVNSARADFAITGKSKRYGLDITTISTPYGDMNITRNIHLDGASSAAKIVGVNMGHVKYRPLVGNGVNRDTSIFVGVQSLENTGVDRRIDLIQTEAGLQVNMPEAHAVWK